MNKKIFILVTAFIATLAINSNQAFAQSKSNQNDKITITARASVRISDDGKTYVVKVGEIQTDKDGYSSVTIYSNAISASIGEANAMFPIIACAKLDNGNIIDPMCREAGIIKADGSKGAGWSMSNNSAVVKKVSKNALGAWSDGTVGFLRFAFDTDEPIKDIIIGTYADYANSNYTAFLSSGISSKN